MIQGRMVLKLLVYGERKPTFYCVVEFVPHILRIETIGW